MPILQKILLGNIGNSNLVLTVLTKIHLIRQLHTTNLAQILVKINKSSNTALLNNGKGRVCIKFHSQKEP